MSLLVFQAWFWLSWENRKATTQTDHCHQFLWYTWGFFGALASACIIFDKQSKTEVAQSVRLSTNVFTHGCLLGGFCVLSEESHSVWKSQKKSHATMRAKRAIFTFEVSGQKCIKNAKDGKNSNATFWVIFKHCEFGSSSWSAWDPIWHRKYTNHVTQDDPLFKVQVLLEFLLNRKFLNSYYRQIPLRVP